jgi:hypothetical protein
MTIIPKAETKLSGWVRDTQKAYKQYINNKPSTMTKEREELLKAANFPFNYPTSTDGPSEQKTKSTPTKHTPKNTLKEKEVGKNPIPTTTPLPRSSTIKKDITTTKADLKTIVPKKQVGKKSITPPTKSTAGIANDKIVSGKKSNPTATKSTACIADDKIVRGKKANPTTTKSTGSFPFFKKLDGKKSNPTPTKSSAITTAKATESQNLESKMTEMKMTESIDTKSKKSSVVTTAKATESQNLESKTTETQMLESIVTTSKNKSTAGSITVKTPSKKRVTKKQSSTASRKRIKIDDATSVNIEATAVKDTSESIFQFTADHTPLQKLHQILNDPHVSPDNPKHSEIAHFVNEQPKSYGITYIEFLRH